jgi:hypothetical protein
METVFKVSYINLCGEQFPGRLSLARNEMRFDLIIVSESSFWKVRSFAGVFQGPIPDQMADVHL